MTIRDYTDPTLPRKDRRRYKIKPRVPKDKSALFSKTEIDLIALRAAGLTHQAAGELVGYPKERAAISSCEQIAKAKKKLNKNEQLQEHLGLKGATLEKVAEVLTAAMSATQPFVVRDSEYVKGEDGKSRKVNTARVEHYPDHRSRLVAAELTTKIYDALPEKKQIIETRTYEQKVAIIAQINQDPEKGMALIQKLLTQKGAANEHP